MNAAKSTTSGAVTVNADSLPILAEILDRNAFGTGFYFGARLGLGVDVASINDGALSYNASASHFVIGPAAGYEFPILRWLAADLDVSWLSGSGETLNFPGLAAISVPSSSALSIQGGVTFRW